MSKAPGPAGSKGDNAAHDPERREHRDCDWLEHEKPGKPAVLDRCWMERQPLIEARRCNSGCLDPAAGFAFDPFRELFDGRRPHRAAPTEPRQRIGNSSGGGGDRPRQRHYHLRFETEPGAVGHRDGAERHWPGMDDVKAQPPRRAGAERPCHSLRHICSGHDLNRLGRHNRRHHRETRGASQQRSAAMNAVCYHQARAQDHPVEIAAREITLCLAFCARERGCASRIGAYRRDVDDPTHVHLFARCK